MVVTARTSRAEIRAAIVAAGLTQAEVAEKLSKDPTTVSRWVTGVQDPSFDVLDQLADAIGRPLVLTFGAAKEAPPPRWATGLVEDVPAIRSGVDALVRDLASLLTALESSSAASAPGQDDPDGGQAPAQPDTERGR